MINQQLLDYVRAQRSVGLTKEAITQALAAGGWTPNDVNEAWMAVEGVRTPPPPPPVPPAPAVGPRTIVPPLGTQPPGNGMPPMPVSTRPIVAQSEFSTAPVMIKKHRRWPLVLLIVILILAIVGGIAAYIYLNPWVYSVIPGFPNSSVTPVPEQTIDTTPSPELIPINATSTATTTSSTTPGQ